MTKAKAMLCLKNALETRDSVTCQGEGNQAYYCKTGCMYVCYFEPQEFLRKTINKFQTQPPVHSLEKYTNRSDIVLISSHQMYQIICSTRIPGNSHRPKRFPVEAAGKVGIGRQRQHINKHNCRFSQTTENLVIHLPLLSLVFSLTL